MKGPFERLKYDLRRLWECPQCKRKERSDGTVTFRFCSCGAKEAGGKPAVMRLVEEAGHRTVPVIIPNISREEAPLPEATVAATREPISSVEAAALTPSVEENPLPDDQSSAASPLPG